MRVPGARLRTWQSVRNADRSRSGEREKSQSPRSTLGEGMKKTPFPPVYTGGGVRGLHVVYRFVAETRFELVTKGL